MEEEEEIKKGCELRMVGNKNAQEKWKENQMKWKIERRRSDRNKREKGEILRDNSLKTSNEDWEGDKGMDEKIEAEGWENIILSMENCLFLFVIFVVSYSN